MPDRDCTVRRRTGPVDFGLALNSMVVGRRNHHELISAGMSSKKSYQFATASKTEPKSTQNIIAATLRHFTAFHSIS